MLLSATIVRRSDGDNIYTFGDRQASIIKFVFLLPVFNSFAQRNIWIYYYLSLFCPNLINYVLHVSHPP